MGKSFVKGSAFYLESKMSSKEADGVIKRFVRENTPCQIDCPDRKTACQVGCKRLKEFTPKLEAFKAEVFKAYLDEQNTTNFQIESAKNTKKRGRKM